MKKIFCALALCALVAFNTSPSRAAEPETGGEKTQINVNEIKAETHEHKGGQCTGSKKTVDQNKNPQAQIDVNKDQDNINQKSPDTK